MSTSRILFHRQYIFRTLNGTLAAILPLSFGIVFVSIAVNLLGNPRDTLTQCVGIGFLIGGIFFGGFGMLASFAWITNKRHDLTISEDGVTFRDHFKSWDEIGAFYGTRYGNGICLGYSPRSRIPFGDGSLQTTPMLTEREYEALALEVYNCIGSRFSHVDVAMHPKESSSGS